MVDPAQVELELCLLSIAYLNFPDICTPGRRQALLSGYYSFYEYAVASWVHHLMAWLSEKHHDEANMAELEETLGPFLDQHSSDECPPSNVSNQMHDKLQVVRHFDFYDSLMQAVVWSRKQFLVVDNPKNDDQTAHQLDFPSITQHVRSLLEDTVRAGLTPEAGAALELYYGNKWFRCPRIHCRHFYDGFTAQEDRDKHVARHERAYMCTFDGCPVAIIGCVSKKDLDKHLLESHSIGSDGGDFPNISNPNEKRIQRHLATFQCTLCPKKFTRAHNLRSHFRRHTNERPFVCTVCGKAFFRDHDRKNHEYLHTREKRFVCTGDLKDGAKWGCGRRFARADALGRHFRSEAGLICIKPLLEEEEMMRQRSLAEAAPTGHLSGEGNPNSSWTGPGPVLHTSDPATHASTFPLSALLPAAVLAQYPALAQVSWGQEIHE